LNSVLGESIERFASGGGLPAIETKGEFSEIGIEVSIGNSPSVSPQEPSLQQRDDPMNTRQEMDVREALAAGSVAYGDILQAGGKHGGRP
jgi:hypothetical protein